MSSKTSTDVRADLQVGPSSDPLQPWQLFTLAGLVGATIVVFMSRGQTPAGIVLLSLTIFAAAVVGIAAWRTLAPLAGKHDLSSTQVLGGRTRAALEREKSLVLRSIKELEFDRAMGKVSEKDFAEMGARLRARAAGLLRQLDAGTGYREQIEKEIAKRLRGPQGSADLTPRGPQGSADLTPRGPQGSAPRATTSTTDAGRAFTARQNVCASCGTGNDADARFCKSCGTSLGTTA